MSVTGTGWDSGIYLFYLPYKVGVFFEHQEKNLIMCTQLAMKKISLSARIFIRIHLYVHNCKVIVQYNFCVQDVQVWFETFIRNMYSELLSMLKLHTIIVLKDTGLMQLMNS